MDRQRIRAVLFCSVSLGLCAEAAAQVPPTTPPVIIRRATPIRTAGEIPYVDRDRLRAAALLQQGQSPAAAATPALDPKLRQAFQQLEFDRRPSTILAEWAKPEPLPVDDDPELVLPAEPPPAPKPPAPPAEGEPPPSPEAQKAAMAEFQKAQQEHQSLQAEYNKNKQEIEQKRQARKMAIVSRNVTLGRWDRLPEFFATFGEEQAAQAYEQFLQKLPATPRAAQQGVSPQVRAFIEKNRFDFDDILDLIGIAPGGFKKEQAKFFPVLLNLALGEGHGFRDWLAKLRDEIGRPEGERRVDGRMAARFLAAQNKNIEMGEFLPTLEEAVAATDREALNLLARYHVALHGKEQKPALLEQAWNATLAALAAGEIDEEQKIEALRRAVGLAPKVRDELGDAWMEESFTERPERGMEVLATVGAQASRGFVEQATNPGFRLEGLQLLKTAVDALLATAPERAAQWRESLNLLAGVWLREAGHSYQFSDASSMGPVAQLDPFGNIYWVNMGRGRARTPLVPIEPGELLELRPDGRWREMLEDSVRPEYDTTIAQLYLKVNEEKLAFPYIEQLAETNTETANQLAREFLNVWIRNNDPNAARNFTNVYNFAYGFSSRASGIPLTRSKQERSLRDLAYWVARLRGVPGIELDTQLLVRAFTSSHSAAEVYRIETMEEVFGTLEDLDAKTLAQMAQTMRANLASTWRIPAVQQQAGTRRRQQDIEREVLEGYVRAQDMLVTALSAHPESWSLMVASAALMHDMNNFASEIAETSAFAEARRAALMLFAGAAETYVAGTADQPLNEESIGAFELWFHAALGASDIPAIDESTVLVRDEIPKIKAALEAISGEAGERHMSRFANSLFTKLSSVNPAVKRRFLDAGFEIVGDHPQARAARKVYEYYADLVSEIRMVAAVEGSTDVGTEPFAVRIDLQYTVEIERESGGFGKYLQNQANSVNAIYNYGRPPENYRDKFEESVRTTLAEHFQVHSITFNSEDVTSKAIEEFGWRRTPYAYLLLQAKGPEVDRIPPLKIDLDFLDVTGYTVLPIISPVVPLDASAEPVARPYQELQVTQILDERKAADGILSMEIKAQATGLVPVLDTIVDLAPSDFEVDDIEDAGVTVSRFGDDRDSIRSERLWIVAMKAREGVEQPTAFRFATPLADSTEVLYQRYDDADLMVASAEVELLEKYTGATGIRWYWFAALPLVALLGFLLYRQTRAPSVAETAGLRLPDRITPFSVLSLLAELRSAPDLSEIERSDLDRTIARIERHYFGQANGKDAPDLDVVVRELADTFGQR